VSAQGLLSQSQYPLSNASHLAVLETLWEVDCFGMSGVDWNSNVLQIRDSIISLKKELQESDPKDRLDSISKIVQCIEFTKQSNIGWASLFTNPPLANQLDEEALKEIFVKFRQMTIERIDNDIDCINRYLINLVPRGT
jgi:hypothetical protein